MSIEIYPINLQAKGNFNNGEILENKPIGFPSDGGKLKPYSNIFYWAHAWTNSKKSTIGLHPHQGFEICSFILKGQINHYDTKQKKWISLSQGDVQIIRSGSGISHAEELMENSEIFQIWFDPNLSNTLNKGATYDDYKNDNFEKIESEHVVTKLIKSSDSKMKMDTEGVFIKEYLIKKELKSFRIDILSHKVHSFLILDGSIKIGDDEYLSGTFFKVSNTNNLEFSINSNVKIFEISTPLKPNYRTYSDSMA
jgi:redox-sensitive bicupin YhaK (pirin superfamily)